MYSPNATVVAKLANTAISQNPADNIRVLRQLRWQIMYSNNLQSMSLTGQKIKAGGWECLSEGCERTK